MLNLQTEAKLHFEKVREIGAEGKNSVVFLARDLQLDAELAVKRITKASFKDVGEYFREASMLYLSDHANVAPIHYACQDDEHIYLAMPFFAAGSLNKVLEARFLSVREIIRYAIQFLSGLHNIHSKGLIHFDIKPDNIMLSNRNEALVSDFGLAQHMNEDGLAEPAASYVKNVPPEGWLQDAHSVQFDIYQVGLTLYRMCCGNAAFYEQLKVFKKQEDFAVAVFKGEFPDRKRFPAHIPNALARVVKACIAPKLEDRYKSVIEVSNALAAIEGNELDWFYTVDADGSRTWTKETDEKTLVLKVDAKDTSEATKRTAQSEQRIKAFCLKNIDDKTIRSFLKEH
ncbi:serine/threonine-protein kinase [Caballeronia sp. LZ033]|uniref:serine/threonine-protein kinase n=1 Tax=Caballeronia sp. LZ033 TaxID=3038566 RepID=UPI00286019E2|nr:serine/threonine-protein kinase [Caballeronia sp. LZ033]MDR5812070.1 serine/threonine-protein kinase [Caballeronia sp. LZ033]